MEVGSRILLTVPPCFQELLPNLPSLVMDPFASHVVRSLLLLLSPSLTLSASRENSQYMVRSKKSAAWKAKQGVMKSVFVDEEGTGKENENDSEAVPPCFSQMTRRIIELFKSQISDNEVRAMAASKVACPGLQVCHPRLIRFSRADTISRCCWKLKLIRICPMNLGL